MRSRGLQIVVQKIGSLASFGYHKKLIVIIMIMTKEVENFLGPPICVQHSKSCGCFWESFHIGLKV